MAAPRAGALRRVAASIRTVLGRTERAVVLLENSAGAGATLGATFEDLSAVLNTLHGDARVGVCLDTAHLFAAGWDLRTPDGVETLAEVVRRTVGWERVRLLHLNDSQGALGSHVDRHQNIGEGLIGTDGFRAIVNHPKIRMLPGIIETPGFDHAGPDKKNLQRLTRLQASTRRSSRKGIVHGRPLR
jgi:deoxyribonuclease-4